MHHVRELPNLHVNQTNIGVDASTHRIPIHKMVKSEFNVRLKGYRLRKFVCFFFFCKAGENA